MLARHAVLLAALVAGCRSSIAVDSKTGAEAKPEGAADPAVGVEDTTNGNKEATKLTSDQCVDPDLSRLANDQTMMLCDGTLTKGTMIAPAPCSSDGQTGCLAVANFPAVDKVTILVANAAKIRDSVKIAGVPGTLADCTANGSNCYVPSYVATNQPLKAIDFDAITPGVVKKSVILAGVTGDYPSSTNPLAGSDGTADLTAPTFDAKIKDGTTNFEWFDADGNRYARAGDSDIVTGNIKDSISVFGTTGNVVGLTAADEWNLRAGITVGTVTGKLKTNCRNSGSTLTFGMGATKSATVTNGTDTLTVTSHGYVTGDPVQIDYTTQPTGLIVGSVYYVIKIDNDTFRLATTAANAFASTVINITADGSGVVVWSVGATPKAATVNNATDTLAITGHGYATAQAVQISYTTAPTGLVIEATYYTIVVDANTIKLAQTPGDAFTGTAMAISADGTGVYVFKLGTGAITGNDSIEDYNYASSVLTSNPWSSSDNICGGVEVTAGDDNVWKDVTTDGGSAPSTCAATPANCAMQDKISGLTWTKTQSTSTQWGKALDDCKNLAFNNQTSGWRLPTQKELLDAYNHGIRSAASSNWITLSEVDFSYFWSSTTSSTNSTLAWSAMLSYGDMNNFSFKVSSYAFACVR